MRKYKPPVIPSSHTQSIRFPNNIIERVEQAIQGTNYTFTAFVVEAVRVALENLEK